MKTLILALFIASCSTPPFPENTERERQCKEYFETGAIKYSEYQKCLESESP